MMLGNLCIKSIEKRTGVVFPKELIEFMEKTYQSKATDIEKRKWHCFDIPFNLVCGDKETAENIYKYLKPLSSDFVEQMQISISM